MTRSRSNSEIDKSTNIKLALVVGFSMVLMLLAIVVGIGISNMDAIQSKLIRIVEDHNVKTNLVTAMRYAARERTINMYRMITLDDPFARDEEFMLFNHHGAQFSRARIALTNMQLNEEEKKILDQQGLVTTKTVDLQGQVIDLVLNDELVKASRLLYAETVPAQNRVFVYLTKLQSYQTQAANNAGKEAKEKLVSAQTLMFICGAAALLVSVLISVLVVRYTTHAEARLYREKEQAEVTLYSIGEGVITTDDKGKIKYLNAVATELTGKKLNQAHGKDLLDVFSIHDDHGKSAEENPVLIAMHENRDIQSTEFQTLKNPNGSVFSIEFTISPIRDYDDSILGAVLVFRNVTEMREMAKQMAFQATHDTLTHLINRHEFEERLVIALQSAREEDRQHILFYMDLDQFKVVNDTCGHIAGDELLKQISIRLHSKVRATDTLARLGGDEFGLLLIDCALDQALQIANLLRNAISEFRFVWEDKSFEISTSIGVVEIRPDSGRITDILASADSACYVAKDLGRNRVHVYQAHDSAVAKRQGEMSWLPRIRTSLNEDKFQLYFQKIVPLSADQFEQHHEILLRMQGPSNETILPGSFIPAAERYDLMSALDRWVIQAAFTYFKNNTDCIYNNKLLWTINLSGQTICDDQILGFIIEQFQVTHVPPQNICFEITETTAISNLSRATRLIETLKKMGCRFSLDDFGSGLSSFNYLKHMKVDFLKIDGSFVKDMMSDPMDLAMVESINQIGQLLGLRTIAEFVEDEETMNKLQAMRIDFAQGYFVHKPEPIQHFVNPHTELVS